MCAPKCEGGLGIRRLQDISAAAGVKLVWRCCNTNSIWAKWMRDQYAQGKNFWEAGAHLMQSGTWKFIVGSNALAKPNMIKCIGNGKSTSLWFEPWTKVGAIADKI